MPEAGGASGKPAKSDDEGRSTSFVEFMLESIRDAIGRGLETEQVKALVLCLKNEALSTREAMKAIGLNHRPTFLYDYLQPALHEEYVEMTHPDSPKSPTQKYRLAEKGKRLVSLFPLK